jgi:thiamine biosynthesis lipoprotein
MATGREPELRRFFAEAIAWVAAFEAKYSRFLPDSLVSRINQGAGGDWVALDPETDRILTMCQEMHFLTRGAFDPTSLPLIRLWNWKVERPAIPQDAEIAAAKELVGWNRVERKPGQVRLPKAGMSLDLGGMGKEYAVDCVSALGAQRGLAGLLVDFGADVRVSGLPPDGRPGWHIGLEDPDRPGTCWTGLAVRDAGVATSGDYVRKFELNGRRYGHIIDVRTGYPVDNGVRAVSVTAPTCTMAGMLSTAAFVLGPEAGLKLIETQMAAAGALSTARGRLFSRRITQYMTH